jgi:signal transduction histidine kinase
MTALKESKLFSSLNEAELEAVRRSCVGQSFAPGRVVFTEGDEGDGIYMVREGLVQISALVGQGQERKVLTRVRPGEFFGEMAVLDREPRSATATAETATSVYFIPREKLLGLLESCPSLAVSLVREFSLRMRDFNRHYIQEVLQAERLTLVGKFARSIVHDFKNPLNIIGLAAELVNMDIASPEMRAIGTERIRKQVDRLTNMINELLEFTRGPQNAVVLASYDYAEYVQGIVEELAPELRDKRVNLVFQNPPPAILVPMDQKRLMHVFTNLVHNAVDAMPAGGTIFFRFRTTPEEVVTEIEDTGQGVPDEILPRLFEAFATFGKAKGTGLGLSICKKIIEDHRGWIEARNEPGGGAVFSFALPAQIPI